MDKITMDDIMQWLEAQRTEANARLSALGDGDESHVEYSSDAKAVRIINAIVERMGEMTAVEYLEAKTEMCDSEWNAARCDRCDLNDPQIDRGCAYFETDHPIRAVEIVKKWKEEQGNGTKAM